jgi:spore coat polysaccharide biosynthesis protein SpsF
MQNFITDKPVIIAVRTGSSRFPDKCLSPLGDVSLIEFIIRRLNTLIPVENICLATTDAAPDDRLERIALDIGAKCFRGSTDDVLARLNGAASYMQCDSFFEILGDNPFIDSNLLYDLNQLYNASDCGYAATATKEYCSELYPGPRFPVGTRIQIISTDAFKRSAQLAVDSYYREHATSYIIQNGSLFGNSLLYASGKYSNCARPELTFAVNVPANLKLCNLIHSICASCDPNYSLLDVLNCFDEHPEFLQYMGNDAIC